MKTRPARPQSPEDVTPLLTLERRPDVVARQVGFDLALYDPATDSLHILNVVAAAVWHHITRDRTFRNITEALQLAFPGASAARIAADVQRLILRLKKIRLLVPTGSEAPRPKVGRLNRLIIPDREISSVSKGYVSPTVKSFTAAQLEKLFGPGDVSVLFSDLLVLDLGR